MNNMNVSDKMNFSITVNGQTFVPQTELDNACNRINDLVKSNSILNSEYAALKAKVDKQVNGISTLQYWNRFYKEAEQLQCAKSVKLEEQVRTLKSDREFLIRTNNDYISSLNREILRLKEELKSYNHPFGIRYHSATSRF